jgi:hypothetical protein
MMRYGWWGTITGGRVRAVPSNGLLLSEWAFIDGLLWTRANGGVLAHARETEGGFWML